MTSIAQGSPTREVRSLTGLRGVAALVVILYHYQLAATGKGYLSVDLFFVLSGFVMALSYGDKLLRDGSLPTYRNFLQRRFARVYPIYLVVLLLTFLTDRVFNVSALATLVTNLFLVQQFGLDYIHPALGKSIVGQGWSISTEFAAYLLFPVLLTVTMARSAAGAAISAICCVATLAVIAWMPYSNPYQAGPLDNHWYLFGLLRCIADFTLGIVTYRVWRARTAWPAWIGVALPIAIVALAYLPGTDLLIVVLLPLLVLSAAQRGSPLDKALSWSPIHFLGEISYSLYMIHILCRLMEHKLIRLATRAGLPDTGEVALYVLICIDIVLAAVCFRVIEKPARRWLRAFFDGRSPRLAAGEPAVP